MFVNEEKVVEEKKEVDLTLIAKPDNIIKGNNYRISVLTERLIRLEYQPEGIFCDQKTQNIAFRNFDRTTYELKEDDKYLNIKTKYFNISYVKGKSFDGGRIAPYANLKIDLNGTDRFWYYNHPEVKNYKGLCGSFDGDEEDLKFRKGLYSLDGFVAIDDSNSYIHEEGKLIKREKPGIDIYLFMYGDDFNLALKDFFKLTGSSPLIPRYALGNWWSRDLDYTGEEIRKVVYDFEKIGAPISIFLLDKGWHILKTVDEKPIITGYSFNKELIKDEVELINELKERNIKVGVHYDPKDGVHPHEENYASIAEYFKIDNKIIAYDPHNTTLTGAIGKFLLNPLKEKGIDFFWNDYQDNKENLWFINNSLLRKNDSTGKRELVLARNSEINPHLEGVVYTGKTLIGWEMLKKIPHTLNNAANAGVSWLSNDIAGNYGGTEDEELYIRSVQLGTFSPILRFHSSGGKYYRKEPWRWNAKVAEITSSYLNLRHRLIPYIYSYAYKYHKEGLPLIKPFYYEEPWVYDDKDYTNQYYFGELLVAPILDKKEPLINRTIHRFYLPDGVWYDYKTGKKFLGKKQYVAFYRDEDYPVFAKRGAIVPLSLNEDINDTNNPVSFEINIFPGATNTFRLYEDDGITNMYKKDKYVINEIDYNYLPSNYTVLIRTIAGGRGILPDYRNYKIRFRNTKQAASVVAYFNDSTFETISYVDDTDFIVEVNNVPSVGQLTLNCKGQDIEIDAVRLINDEIDSIILDLPINTVLKEKISGIMFSDLPIRNKRIEIRKLSKYNLSREYIRLFLKLLEYISTI